MIQLENKKYNELYSMQTESIKTSQTSVPEQSIFDSITLKKRHMNVKKPSTCQIIFHSTGEGYKMVEEQDVYQENPQKKTNFSEPLTEQGESNVMINDFLNLSINREHEPQGPIQIKFQQKMSIENIHKTEKSNRVYFSQVVLKTQIPQGQKRQILNQQTQNNAFIQRNFSIIPTQNQNLNPSISIAKLRQDHSILNKTEIHSIHNGKDDTHLDKDSSSRKKSTRKSSVHSDSDEYVPHRRKSSHKVLSAFIGPKNGKNQNECRAGVNNQSNTQRFIKKMSGYHYSKNFQQFYNSRLSEKFKCQKQFDNVQKNQKIQAIDQIIGGLQSHKVSVHKKMSEEIIANFDEQLSGFIVLLFEQVFRRGYEVMLNTQKRRILQESQEDSKLTSQYFDSRGYEQFCGLFEKVLGQKQHQRFYHLLVDSQFQEVFKIQLPIIIYQSQIKAEQ